MKGPHERAALDVETDDQGRELHSHLWLHRAEHHQDMTPAELDDLDTALRRLEEADPELAKQRTSWQRRQTRDGLAQLKREHQERQPRPPKRPAPTRPRRGRAFTAGLVTGRAHPLAEATGLPGTARSAASTALAAIGGIIGLSIVYAILTSTEDRGRYSAPVLFIEGVSGLMRRIVGVADPLGSHPLPAPGGAAIDSSGFTDPLSALGAIAAGDMAIAATGSKVPGGGGGSTAEHLRTGARSATQLHHARKRAAAPRLQRYRKLTAPTIGGR